MPQVASEQETAVFELVKRCLDAEQVELWDTGLPDRQGVEDGRITYKDGTLAALEVVESTDPASKKLDAQIGATEGHLEARGLDPGWIAVLSPPTNFKGLEARLVDAARWLASNRHADVLEARNREDTPASVDWVLDRGIALRAVQGGLPDRLTVMTAGSASVNLTPTAAAERTPHPQATSARNLPLYFFFFVFLCVVVLSLVFGVWLLFVSCSVQDFHVAVGAVDSDALAVLDAVGGLGDADDRR